MCPQIKFIVIFQTMVYAVNDETPIPFKITISS